MEANQYDKRMETKDEELYRINNNVTTNSVAMSSASATRNVNQILSRGGDEKADMDGSVN